MQGIGHSKILVKESKVNSIGYLLMIVCMAWGEAFDKGARMDFSHAASMAMEYSPIRLFERG